MSFIQSPNMNLSIPGVGTEPGPQWASDLNLSLTLIDQHDHSPGRGVQITPAGMNINTSLSLQNNSLTSINSLVFQAQTSVSTIQALYVKPGTETPAIQDLWFNDGAGNAVQLTSGGEVNATIASLPGENYAAGTFFWKQGAGSTVPANFDIGSITIRPNTALTTNGITISPPGSIASAYNFVLPLLPSVPSFLQIDNSGNVTAVAPVSTNTPDNAGSQSLFLRQNSSGGYTWQQFLQTIQNKTSTYNISPVDDVILVSGGVFTVTLPTAVGFQGKQIIIKKTDSSLTNIITIATTSSQTIDGSLTRTLNTINEVYTVVSDGSNWQILEHLTITPWTIITSTITGTTTNPTKGAGVNFVDKLSWRRDGSNMEIMWAYFQNTAGTAGSGAYLFAIPGSQLLDTSPVNLSFPFQSTIDSLHLGAAGTTVGTAFLSSATGAGTGSQVRGAVMPYSTSELYVIFEFPPPSNAGQSIVWGSSGSGMTLATAGQWITLTARLPISGWSA